MAILTQQTEFNRDIYFGNMDEEKICQSFFLPQSFVLDTISIKWTNVGAADPNVDVQFRVEVRSAVGPDHLLDVNSLLIDSSPWIEDAAMVAAEIAHSFSSLTFGAGWYWFMLVTNRRFNLSNISAGAGQSGTYLAKYIKLENGSGIYRTDRNLFYKINGSYPGVFPSINTYAFNQPVTTMIRDET